MITDDQITALAREYAEEVYRNAHKEMEVLPNCLSNEAINMFAQDMESKLKWLLHRFCLVEKECVNEAYKGAIETIRLGEETGAYSLCTFGSARRILLESFFPELGKEVEE